MPNSILELANATRTSPRVASIALTSIMPTLPAEIALSNGRNRSGYLAGLMMDIILAIPSLLSLCT